MAETLTLSPADFHAFFAAVNDGRTPFTWQQRLVEHIVAHGRWPAQIIAPTGAGKSAVVEAHVFVNALAACGAGPRVPRRLFTVVNRRALVDNQHDRATTISDALQAALSDDSPSVLRSMAQALASLRTVNTGGSDTTEMSDGDIRRPIDVGLLRGGLTRDNPTLLDPSACAVINATPDMWGSRLLFHGYGASRRARPREAAVAAYDSVMVLDESHLNRQLLITARRIAGLVGMEKDLGIPRLQVVETTATPTAAGTDRIGVESADLEHDTELAERIRAHKPLSLVTSENWLKQATGKRSSSKYVTELAEAVRAAHRSVSSDDPAAAHTVGCIVNRVNTAVDVATALRKDKGLRVKVLVGRMRPADLTELRNEHPNLFTVAGDPEVDVLVATQTLEVGVDVDFAALVTELASASALTQRFGRVNRLGRRAAAPVTVLVPDKAPAKDCLPYTVNDLTSCLDWLTELVEEHDSVSPQALAAVELPVPSRRRALFQRPEWADVNRWSRTGDRLFAEDDLDIWLRDDLAADRAQAGIVVRRYLPLDDLAAVEVLRATMPRAEEEFPARVQDARSLISHLLDGTAGKKASPCAFIVHDGEISPVTADGWSVRPGDTVVVDYGARFTTHQVATDVAEASDVPDAVTAAPFTYIADPELCSQPDEKLTGSDIPELRRAFVGMTVDDATEAWNSTVQDSERQGTVILPTTVADDADAVPWFVVRHDRLADDAAARQQWTSAPKPVLLSDHSRDVAARAGALSTAVALAPQFQGTVVAAALHHDDGKADPRFQLLLGNTGPVTGSLRAKGTGQTRRQNRGPAGHGGLPVGWRHEQYSAVLTEQARRGGDDTIDDLTLRLVGTSHGHGRSGFPHVGAELLAPGCPGAESEIAEELFTTGRWDEVVEQTDEHIGHYAVSYLEALVRAADNQISKEGH